MNEMEFKAGLEQLGQADWQAVLDGAGIIVEQDAALVVGDADAAFVAYELGDEQFSDAQALRDSVLARASEIWREYYCYNPFSKQGFYRRVRALLDEYGPLSFISMPNKPSEHRIFIEGASIQAVTQAHPVFKYAFYLQLDQALPDSALTNKINNWLNSGSAYADYISVHVCRFGSQSEG